MSRASEREAAAKAAAILARATKRGDTAYDGEYGQGKLTKAQRESQERHIPMTKRDDSRRARAARALWG